MYRVDVSVRAEQDLDRIVSYIAVKLDATKAASDFIDAVYDCYDILENNPYLYEKCRDVKLLNEDYRRAVVKNYVLVYKVDEETKTVIVHRFFLRSAGLRKYDLVSCLGSIDMAL